MLAKTKNLVGISGPSSDSAAVLTPILENAHIPAFEDTGQALFDHSTDPYFYRIVPADDTTGFAMAAYAYQRGYRRAAFVFSNDLDAQGNKPSAVAGWKNSGARPSQTSISRSTSRPTPLRRRRSPRLIPT